MGEVTRWERFRHALVDEPLPAALVDLDAFDANRARLHAAAGKKPVRVATKSIRCPELVRRAGDVRLMTYCAAETAWWVKEGARDLLLAYPTVRASDCALLAEANRVATAAVIADDAEQLAPLERAARAAGTRIPVVVELDMSWRPAGVHLGVRRSPIREPAEVVALARKIADSPSLRFHGIMGYEAQIAGLTDAGPFGAWQNPVKRALKRGSRGDVEKRRAQTVAALAEAGLAPLLVNGGGTGSVEWSSAEPALTELTIGSGYLAGHLFDYYAGLELDPALHFALQVVRRPATGMVTCHGGGWIASGAIGPDRLPLPVEPPGCRLLPMEGAGEVQTPVVLPDGADVALGEPIFFRPAKSGEPAEHFDEYLLVRGDRIEGRAKTYRGLGLRFLG